MIDAERMRKWLESLGGKKRPMPLWFEYGKAQAMLTLVTVERLEDAIAHFPRERKLTRYKVSLAGLDLGRVEQTVTHSYRKAGRLISRSWHPTEWTWVGARFHMCGPGAGLTFRRRIDAIESLCRNYIREAEKQEVRA